MPQLFSGHVALHRKKVNQLVDKIPKRITCKSQRVVLHRKKVNQLVDKFSKRLLVEA